MPLSAPTNPTPIQSTSSNIIIGAGDLYVDGKPVMDLESVTYTQTTNFHDITTHATGTTVVDKRPIGSTARVTAVVKSTALQNLTWIWAQNPSNHATSASSDTLYLGMARISGNTNRSDWEHYLDFFGPSTNYDAWTGGTPTSAVTFTSTPINKVRQFHIYRSCVYNQGTITFDWATEQMVSVDFEVLPIQVGLLGPSGNSAPATPIVGQEYGYFTDT